MSSKPDRRAIYFALCFAVGARQTILYVVFDKWAKTPRAAASRDVIIADPCPPGQTQCSDDTCSAVDCNVRAAVQAVAGDAALAEARSHVPVLLLVNGSDPRVVDLGQRVTVNALTNVTARAAIVNGTGGPLYDSGVKLVLPYGSKALYSLLPCATVGSLSGCCAVAVDALEGDLSAYITVG